MLAMIGFFVLLVVALFLTAGFFVFVRWSLVEALPVLFGALVAWGAVFWLCPFEIAMKGGA